MEIPAESRNLGQWIFFGQPTLYIVLIVLAKGKKGWIAKYCGFCARAFGLTGPRIRPFSSIQESGARMGLLPNGVRVDAALLLVLFGFFVWATAGHPELKLKGNYSSMWFLLFGLLYP